MHLSYFGHYVLTFYTTHIQEMPTVKMQKALIG